MKKVMHCVYVHKSNLKELYEMLTCAHIEAIKQILELHNENYEVVKYDLKNGTLSLIDSPDWNESYEPIVGDSVVYDLNSKEVIRVCKMKKNNPQIYHTKEVFVSSDYEGFDVEEAKKRTKIWNSIPNINSMKSKIGYRNYWIELMKKNNLPY